MSESFSMPFFDLDVIQIGTNTAIYDVKDSKIVDNHHHQQKYHGDGFIIFLVKKPDLFFCNGFKTLHGGAIANWALGATSLALIAFDKEHRRSNVALQLSIDYQSAQKVHRDIYVKANIKKLGKNVVFLECVLSDAETGREFAIAKQSKLFLNAKM